MTPLFVSLFCFLFFPFIIQYLTKHDTWNTRLSLQSHRTKSRQMAWELSLSQYLGGMYQSPALYDIWSSVIALRPSGTDEWRRDGGMTFKDWQTEWQRFEYLIICSFNSEVSIQHCHFESLCSVFLNGILSVVGTFLSNGKFCYATINLVYQPVFKMRIQCFCPWIILQLIVINLISSAYHVNILG